MTTSQQNDLFHDDLPRLAMEADNVPVWPGDVQRGEIEVLDSSVAWSNGHVRLFDDRVRYPTIKQGDHIEGHQFRLAPAAGKSDGIVIVPITRDDRILLVRQFRHAVRRWVREIPRGAMSTDESVEDAVSRELSEEMGCRADRVFPLGTIANDTGQLAGVPRLVVARVTEAEHNHPEATEVIDVVVSYRYDDLRRACQHGHIIDAFTMCAVVRLEPHFVTGRFVYLPEEAAEG